MLPLLAAGVSFWSSPAGAALAWEAFARAFAAVQAVALLGWAVNLPALAGDDGLTPAAASLRAYARDFGAASAVYWPSAFWG